MTFRYAQDTRANGRVHLFEEGRETSLCGRDITRFLARPDTEIATCRHCVDRAVTLRNEEREQAS